MRCCETTGNSWAASRGYCAWWANHAQPRADDRIALETGRWVIPGLTSQIVIAFDGEIAASAR